MGSIKKPRKQYSSPRHPWQKTRIDEERNLVQEYGLRNKVEIYKHTSQIKRMIAHYKKLNYRVTEQASKEKQQLLDKAVRYGFMAKDQELSFILGLTVKDVLERRLQTLVFKRKLARSVKQARQFITHRHILVNGRVVDAPSFIVPKSEETSITFIERSALSSETHPERAIEKPVAEPVLKEVVPEKAADEKEIEEPAKVEPTPVQIKEEAAQ